MLELGQGCSNMDTVMRVTEVGATIDEYSGQHTLSVLEMIRVTFIFMC